MNLRPRTIFWYFFWRFDRSLCERTAFRKAGCWWEASRHFLLSRKPWQRQENRESWTISCPLFSQPFWTSGKSTCPWYRTSRPKKPSFGRYRWPLESELDLLTRASLLIRQRHMILKHSDSEKMGDWVCDRWIEREKWMKTNESVCWPNGNRRHQALPHSNLERNWYMKRACKANPGFSDRKTGHPLYRSKTARLNVAGCYLWCWEGRQIAKSRRENSNILKKW